MNGTTLATVLTLAATFLLTQPPARAVEPALPELKPLDRFVGSSRSKIEGSDATIDSRSKWILGGRFVLQEWTANPGDEGLILWGYDPQSGKYLKTTFNSSGFALMETGTWDAKTDTLSTEARVANVVVRSTARALEDRGEWSFTVLDDKGTVLQSMKGTALPAELPDPQPAGPAQPALPELKPLSRFVGSWKATIDGGEVAGRSRTEWILGGRFVRQDYTTSTGGEGLILRGYDPNAKQYVTASFDSSGMALMQTGTWDDKTNTLTVEARPGNVVIRTRVHFPDDDTEQWSVSVLDENEAVLHSVKGSNVRTKQGP